MTPQELKDKLALIDVAYIWKVDLLKKLAQDNDIDIFFETGTWLGSTPIILSPYFKNIYTIESSLKFYRVSKTNIDESGVGNVKQYFGSSKDLLENALIKDVPPGLVLFYLDAHGSGGDTTEGFPTPRELEIIMRLRPDALIAIDDMENPTHPESNFKDVKKIVDSSEGWSSEWRRHSEANGTGFVILHKGQYKL